MITFSHPKVDVFLSFRGEEVRKTILSHLSRGFARNGIRSFKNEREEENADCRKQVPPSVLRAISESEVTVVLLSDDYASSSWSLNELVQIMETKSTTVVPVYYEVDMSDVRHQTGKIGEDLQSHQLENPETLQRWKVALTELTDNKLCFSSRAMKDDSKLIREITLCVSGLLSKSRSHKEVLHSTKKNSSSHLVSDPHQLMTTISAQSKSLVAMDDRMKAIYAVLDLESTSEVRVIGISGVQGIGKTTIARRLYQEFSSAFQDHRFHETSGNTLDHVSGTKGISKTSSMRCLYKKSTPDIQDHCSLETSRNVLSQGLVSCAPLSSSREDIPSRRGLKRKTMRTLCSDMGSDDKMGTRFWNQRVLVIVDNVETIEQLKEIMKEVNRLGPGSRVIVTTQDNSLFSACGVEHVYEMDCLKHDEALELFSQCAFKSQYPPANFEQLSVRAVQLTGCLPLGLKLLGSFLCGKAEEDWEFQLQRLEARQDKAIVELSQFISHGIPQEETSSLHTIPSLVIPQSI